jgi:hypothetical protein
LGIFTEVCQESAGLVNIRVKYQAVYDKTYISFYLSRFSQLELRKLLDEIHRENQNALFTSCTFFLKFMLFKRQLQAILEQERPKNYVHLDMLQCDIINQRAVTSSLTLSTPS